MASLRSAQLRHSEFFESILRSAYRLFREGYESQDRSFQLLDVNWKNIRRGQGWAAANLAKDDKAAELISDYLEAGDLCSGHPSFTF
jgi:hypothetical protein